MHIPNTAGSNISLKAENFQCFILQKIASLHSRNFLPRNIIIDFSPRFTPNSVSASKTLKTLPKYNLDGLYYTPAFLVPYFDNSPTLKKKKVFQQLKYNNFCAHMKKMTKLAYSKLSNKKTKKSKKSAKITANKQANQIWKDFNIPLRFEPAKQNYCGVCSINFQDYWFHINSSMHKHSIQKRDANSYIHQICSNYQRNIKKSKPQISMDSSKICLMSTQASDLDHISENASENLSQIEIQKRVNKLNTEKPLILTKCYQNNSNEQLPQQNQNCQNFNMLFNLKQNFFADDDYQINAQNKVGWDIFLNSNGQNSLNQINNFLNF